MIKKTAEFSEKNALFLAIALIFSGGAFSYMLHTIKSYDETLQSTLNLLTEVSEDHQKTTSEKSTLQNQLASETEKNVHLESEYQNAKETADELKKISKTDPELLQKYSKVYFLNENYIPKKLSNISTDYLIRTNKPEQFLSSVKGQLEEMIDDAEDDEVTIKVLSAYRSFEQQKNLKSSYNVVYGANTANKFSAEQGFSEHQLGTTVDFTTPEIGTTSVTFEKSEAFKWLTENAHKYGFVLSYPRGNTYYTYEPWHWRYVGVDLATDLYEDEEYFYNLDQRDLDRYIGKFFD